MVADGSGHALDGLLCAMPSRLVFGLAAPTKAADGRDIPHARLRAVTAPAGALSILDGVPARLVLPVVVTARYREMLLAPDYLTAQLEIGFDERLWRSTGA